MLRELEAHHATLINLIADMVEVTAAGSPDLARLAATRLKLSRASRARTGFLVAAVYPAVLARVADSQAEQVRNLQREAEDQRATSSRHIGTWSSEKISADWPGFQRASASIRAMMLERIEREKKILYPLLG